MRWGLDLLAIRPVEGLYGLLMTCIVGAYYIDVRVFSFEGFLTFQPMIFFSAEKP